MKYRVKIYTFTNGRKEYKPQKKMRIGWADVNWEGKAHFMYETICHSMEKALSYIDLNFEGNSKVQKIEIEYITK